MAKAKEETEKIEQKTEISKEDKEAIAKAKELLAKKKEKQEKTEEPVEIEETPKKSKEKFVSTAGIAYIYTSYNNTIVHITDLSGNTIVKVSGGQITKHDRLKANPTVAMFAAKKAAEVAKEHGIDSLYVRTKAKGGLQLMPGPGSHAAVKSLAKEGFKIINIVETTPFARGGSKLKGGKRGRRV